MGPPRPARLRLATFLALALLAAGCGNPFFSPIRGLGNPPGTERIPREDVFFASGDGVLLHGWLIPPKGGGKPKGTVLFLHGTYGNIATNLSGPAWLSEEGFTVFTFDYRGYGRSDGTPTFDGIHADARAALELLPSLPGVAPDRVAVVGQSLGGSVAIYTVAHAHGRPAVKALVVDSAFSAYRQIVRDRMTGYPLAWLTKYPASFLFPDGYRAEEAIGRVAPVPVVIIHGTDDRVVPFAHGELLFERARDPKAIWPVRGAGHGEGLSDAGIRRRLADFLERTLAGASAP